MVGLMILMRVGEAELCGPTMVPILIGIQKVAKVQPAKWSNFKLDLIPCPDSQTTYFEEISRAKK